jgi:hypothetical protein
MDKTPPKLRVDENVLMYADIRVDMLTSGNATPEDFAKMMKPEDPFEIRNGVIMAITREELDKRGKEHIRMNVEHLRTTAGLSPTRVWDARAKVLPLFPEMADKFKAAEEQIAAENCQSCALNKKVMPLVVEIVQLAKDGRDLSSLAPLFGPPPIEIMAGRKVITEADIQLPPQMTRVFPPLRIGAQRRAMVAAADTPLQATQEASAPDRFDAESPGGFTRQGCALCCRKHLSQAAILLKECLQGYSPEEGYLHMSYAMGHLAEAADEIVADDRGLAARIREVRNSLMGME